MNKLPLLAFSAVLLALIANSYAGINVTYVNTTVILGTNTTAHVIEIFTLQVSGNASIQEYQQDRAALNLTLADWQKVLFSGLFTEHIMNPKSSISNVTFLPGPLLIGYASDTALLTVDYYALNASTVTNTAPRKFQYLFNTSVFNYPHSSSGEALPTSARLNLLIPQGAQVASIYPLPDLPSPTLVNDYKNVTEFSWNSGEPLSKFTFSYIVTQTLQQEVLSYFGNVYTNYALDIVFIVIILVVVLGVYFYTQNK